MRVQSTPKQVQGDSAEQQACDFLEKQQFRVVTRNYLCKVGEIDLIMRDGNYLVFVEVRYRSRAEYGSPLESITYTKQKRIIRAAEHYLQKKRLTDKIPCRFDVIAIQPEQPVIWIKNAFDA